MKMGFSQHLIGGIFLVAATTIGVGMLALPVATGPSGFFPSVMSYVICWAVMVATAFLILELTLSMPPETSFISMFERILGPIGRSLCWLIYLFLFITVMIAHIAGGGPILRELTGLSIPNWLFAILYTGAIAPAIYLGTRSVDRLNLVLFSFVGLSYLSIFFVSFDRVDFDLLTYCDWNAIWYGLPILFTAFTFQLIIPTLATYLNRNVRKIRFVIFFGSLIPLIVYLLWELLILGIIPVDHLVRAGQLGQNAVEPLREATQTPSVYLIGNLFAFFALTTSFIPFSLAFFDFLADGLKVKKEGMKKLALILGIFVPPLIIALLYPDIFLIALGYAGGVSCALLFGFFPPLMAWVNRYVKKAPALQRQLPGGKPLLLGIMTFALLILIAQVVQSF